MPANRYAQGLLDFINASPTPYHAVSTTKKLLKAEGFTEIFERDSWDNVIKPLGKYFLTRNGSSIIAFAVSGNWKPGNGISIIGAHTDSPTLRVKPNSKKTSAGYNLVGVETYGGGTWTSWFDRDLSVAGRLFVRDHVTGQSVPKLVKVDKPILKIPNLAIHLDRNMSAKLEINKETQLQPILSLVESTLNQTTSKTEEHEETAASEISSEPIDSVTKRHQNGFVDLIASEAGVSAADIEDFELVLYDTQKSVIGGLNDEFIFSPRLDNQCSCYMSTIALLESLQDQTAFSQDDTVRMIALFDHEEIGSNSAQGAGSNLLLAILARLASLKFNGTPAASSSVTYETYIKSFLLSSDMAHSVHPNYEAKYEANHKPIMNKGPVIKINANQRYATNSPGILLIKEAAKLAGVPLQLFVIRNDSSCGSTIGPILASKIGIRTLDIGNPQLAMHSVRETGGSKDVELGVQLFTEFFKNYSKLESSIVVETE